METKNLALAEIEAKLNDQGVQWREEYNFNMEHTKNWGTIVIASGEIYAEQEPTVNGDSEWHLCDRFVDSEGRV